MYRKVVVGFRDNEHGREALALGRIMAIASDAEMDVVTAPEEHGADLLALARARGADLLVIGSTHRGAIGRVLPGATIEHLLGEAPFAIAVAPPGFGGSDDDSGWRLAEDGDGADAGLRVIGVGFDGSPAAREALAIATDLALANGAALRVFAVARKLVHAPGSAAPAQGPGAQGEVEALREALHEAVADLPAEVRALPVFLRGFVADELVAAARVGVDLLVIGSRRGGPLRRVAHRSVSSFVVNEAHCPVLICPRGVPAPRASSALR